MDKAKDAPDVHRTKKYERRDRDSVATVTTKPHYIDGAVFLIIVLIVLAFVLMVILVTLFLYKRFGKNSSRQAKDSDDADPESFVKTGTRAMDFKNQLILTKEDLQARRMDELPFPERSKAGTYVMASTDGNTQSQSMEDLSGKESVKKREEHGTERIGAKSPMKIASSRYADGLLQEQRRKQQIRQVVSDYKNYMSREGKITGGGNQARPILDESGNVKRK